MSNSDIYGQLEIIASKPDFAERSSKLVEAWSQVGMSVQVVEPILKFMEAHPEIDFGAPGELVHLVERFYGNGYEAELIESVNRKPTQHTIWMLNRIINDTKLPEMRKRYISVLERARLNPLTDHNARLQIDHFLRRLSA